MLAQLVLQSTLSSRIITQLLSLRAEWLFSLGNIVHIGCIGGFVAGAVIPVVGSIITIGFWVGAVVNIELRHRGFSAAYSQWIRFKQRYPTLDDIYW